jgi:tetratricopeptide (TPR) repeat protein
MVQKGQVMRIWTWLLLAGLALAPGASLLPAQSSAAGAVKVWEQDLVLPTYLAGDPEPNPMFYFGRASQGAEGRVYPYPLYDTLTHKKVDKAYKMVYLENEYVRVGIMPEIGGRVFEAVDKTNNYHFFYRQHVIKPALIGLIGAWISGGVEWNIPHHHRASTFLPVQYSTEQHADGSKTVWVGELEIRHRMRWAVGYTLHPGKSILETKLRVLNRTPVVNTMLAFANVAVHVNDDYQVIFPPSTQYVTHHHKREFATWPMMKGRYGGWDFGNQGVDASWFKNNISANSMFAWNYIDDFLAGYDHGKQAGTMAVADHHIVPGKKLWTWGTGPRGRMWDKILTDEDGPYIELMVGAYSDNQPDYTWLSPYETKAWEQYWYPFRDIGGAKNANLDAAVNLDMNRDGTAKLGFYTTSAHSAATVMLTAGDKVLLKQQVSIHPGKPWVNNVKVPAGTDEHDLRASLMAGGRELVSYSPVKMTPEPMPKSVEPPAAPEKIQTVEELYLTGLRIEQFHNPALDPDPYWEEALRRDPGDTRVNTALGINYLKKARYAEAEKLLRKALERLTDRYTTPKDAEATYYLGVALRAQGKSEEALNTFQRATWNAPWRDAGYYASAEIAAERKDWNTALGYLDRSLEANARNIRALSLKSAVLRNIGRSKEALEVVARALEITDPLDVKLLTERWLAGKSAKHGQALGAILHEHPHTALETAAEYQSAGLWKDGTAILSHAVATARQKDKLSPLVYYYLAYFAHQSGDHAKAVEYGQLAQRMSPEYVFPFQPEIIPVLRWAMQAQPRDAKAPYYLGNLLFDWQPGEAVAMWERSAAADPAFPIVHRNLAVAYSHGPGGEAELKKAIASLEKAVALGDHYPVHFFELDELYERAGVDPQKRLAMLEKHRSAVARRDDALSRAITLKVFAGQYDEAIQLMTGRQFSVWEGGTRFNVPDSWTDAHLLRGHEHMRSGKYREALADYQQALEFPESLQAERTEGASRAAEVAYWIGSGYEAQGDQARAREAWQKAATAETWRGRRRFSGMTAERGMQMYFQAMAMQKLGQAQGEEIFQSLVEAGEEVLKSRSAGMDFFSSFADRGTTRERQATGHYLKALGYLGQKDGQLAEQQLRAALAVSPDHLGAKSMLAGMARKGSSGGAE